MFTRTHLALEVVEDVYLVVDVELVVLHEAHGVRVLPLHPPHVLTQLRATLPHPPGQVLADVNGGAFDQVPFLSTCAILVYKYDKMLTFPSEPPPDP